MSTTPVVLGEGSYGCIHSPSLKCVNDIDVNNNKVTYTNKVSKVLSNNFANIEINEYTFIDNLDPYFEFHLKTPILCNYSKSTKNDTAFNLCTNKANIPDPKNLILMENGGENLYDFSTKLMKSSKSISEKQTIIKDFWIEIRRVILGVKKIFDNDAIHYDLKAQNIIYDVNNKRSNIIDFGLMTRKKDLISKVSDPNCIMSIFHFSYPLEHSIIARKIYDNIDENNYLTTLSTTPNYYNTGLSTINFLFDNGYLLSSYRKEYDKEFKSSYPKNLFNSYNEFMNKCVESIDIYGLGIAFNNVLNITQSLYSSHPNILKDFKNLFYEMIRPNLTQRIDINTFINKYENLINIHFNHTYPEQIVKQILNQNNDAMDIDMDTIDFNVISDSSSPIDNPPKLYAPPISLMTNVPAPAHFGGGGGKTRKIYKKSKRSKKNLKKLK